MMAEGSSHGSHDAPARLTLILISRSGGGALRVVTRLASTWSQAGRDVRIVTNLSDRLVRDGLLEGVQLIPLPPLPLANWASPLVRGLRLFRYSIVASLALRRYVRTAGNGTVLAFLPGTALLVLAATVGLLNSVVVCERNDLTRQAMPWPVRLGRRLLYPRSAAITVNHHGSQLAARRISGDVPIILVGNPPPSLADRPADVESSRTVLNVGRLVHQKNHHALLRAIADPLVECIPGWTLRIVGDGPLRDDLHEQASALSSTDCVTFTGHVDDVDPHYQDAAFLVLTSRWEGTPNVVLEAQAHGLPVLLPARIADGAGLISDGEDGFMYDPQRPGDLEQHLATLMSDSSLRVRLGVAARIRAEQRLKVDTAGEWLRAIDSLPTVR